jgi:uncharacterized membrane protein YphA (DoxX/SURF4 family)
MKYMILLGRLLFTWIFLSSSIAHFSGPMIEHAASKGVPMASLLVPIAGVLCLVGGLCVLLGFKARFGAWLLILFLVPVTYFMHDYWNVADPMQHMQQMVNFNKNMALIGGALYIACYGAGALSIDVLLSHNRHTPMITRGFGTMHRGKQVATH